MAIKIDRFHNQLFITPNIGITYGRPNGKHMFCICLSWLCFGVAIGFIKAKPKHYERMFY